MATVGINGLYPPVFEQSYMPAFVLRDTFRVYFSISPYNSINDYYKWCQVEIRNQKTNMSVITKNAGQILYERILFDQKRKQYYIVISTSHVNINIDEFYKVQIRFLQRQALEKYFDDKEGKQSVSGKRGINQPPRVYSFIQQYLPYFSEWSTVCLIKPISQPVVYLNNWDKEDTGDAEDTTFYLSDIELSGSIGWVTPGTTSTYVGETENVKSYQIKLYDAQENLLEASDVFYKNSNNEDTNFTYNLKYNFPKDTFANYTLKITVVTDNLYKFTEKFPFQLSDNFYQKFKGTITATADDMDGSAIVTVAIQEASTNISENLILRRASNKDNYKYWEIVYITQLASNADQTITWRDYTLEPGTWYRYQAYLKNKNGQKSEHITCTNDQLVMIYSEDIFLTTKDYQLRVRFDPQISSFSHVISESLTATLGAKYPFIRRNGKQDYRSFSLSGTISAFMDLRENKMKASYEDLYDTISLGKYSEFNEKNHITLYNDYLAEKNFRDKVVEFLYADDAKLFRSLPQGNMIVKLMNISLTPNNSLGRLIYSFSCTVNEIDECIFSNYDKYNIQMIGVENYPASQYYVKYGELHIPYSLAGVVEPSSTQSSQRKLMSARSVTKTAESITKEQKYLPSQSGGLLSLIEKRINNNITSKEYYTVAGLKYLKISFTSDPYPIMSDANGYSIAKITDDEGKPITVSNGNYMLGHLLNIGTDVVMVGEHGNFELSDFDLSNISSTDLVQYDIDNDNNILLPDVSCVKEDEQGSISYVALVEATLKQNAVADQIRSVHKISQYWGHFKTNTSLYNKLLRKYAYRIQTSKTLTVALVNDFDKVYIQAMPGTIVQVKESRDTDFNTHIIGETGFLAFDDDDTSVVDIKFTGVKLRKNNDTNTATSKILNSDDYEWYDFRPDDEDDNEEEEILTPVRNGVYRISGNNQIFYGGQWVPFDVETGTVECSEIDCIVDYYFKITKYIYNIDQKTDTSTITPETEEGGDSSSETGGTTTDDTSSETGTTTEGGTTEG